jgi:hypothetical protein
MTQLDWNLSDWNVLPDEVQQNAMRVACESKTKLKIGGREYSVDLTSDGRFALVQWGFLSLIRSWFKQPQI